MDRFKRLRSALFESIPNSPHVRRTAAATKRAEALLEAQEFADAENLLLEAVEELKSEPQAKRRCGPILLKLATAQWHQHKSEHAKQHAQEACELLRESGEATALAECFELLGSIALQAGDDPGAAAKWFEQAVDKREQDRAGDPSVVLRLRRRVSEALRKAGDFARARAALDIAIKIANERFGAHDVQMAECLLEAAHCEVEQGNTGTAMSAVERALEIYTVARGPDSEEAAKTLQLLATICQSGGDLEKALAYYERALQVRERQLGTKSVDFATLLMGLGGTQLMLGRSGAAVEALQQAVVRLEGTADDKLASALDALSNSYFQFGRFEDAVASLRKARALWETSPEKNRAAIEANEQLLVDVASYLPENRRLALGLDVGAGPALKKRRVTPWDVEESAASCEPQQPHREPVAAANRRRPVAGRYEAVTEALSDLIQTVWPVASAPLLDPFANPGHSFAGSAWLAPAPPGPSGLEAVPAALVGPRAPILRAGGYAPVFTSPAIHVPPSSDQGLQPGGGLVFTLVRPDGSPAEIPNATAGAAPMYVTLVVGDSASPAAPPAVPQRTGLHGWDDLLFDFLPLGAITA